MGVKPYLTHEGEKEPVELLINWAMINKEGRKEGSCKHNTHCSWEEGNEGTENIARKCNVFRVICPFLIKHSCVLSG